MAPAPLSVTAAGAPDAFEFKLSRPEKSPRASGENVICTVQEAFDASVAGQSSVSVNAPVMLKPFTVRSPVPALLNVTGNW